MDNVYKQKRCPCCKKKFYPHTPSQKFINREHRIRYYAKTKYHKKYMKEYSKLTLKGGGVI